MHWQLLPEHPGCRNNPRLRLHLAEIGPSGLSGIFTFFGCQELLQSLNLLGCLSKTVLQVNEEETDAEVPGIFGNIFDAPEEPIIVDPAAATTPPSSPGSLAPPNLTLEACLAAFFATEQVSLQAAHHCTTSLLVSASVLKSFYTVVGESRKHDFTP